MTLTTPSGSRKNQLPARSSPPPSGVRTRSSPRGRRRSRASRSAGRAGRRTSCARRSRSRRRGRAAASRARRAAPPAAAGGTERGAPRSRPGRRVEGARALAIARLDIVERASAASPITSPLAGSTTGNVAPDAAATSSPPIASCGAPGPAGPGAARRRREPWRAGRAGCRGPSRGRRRSAREATGAPAVERAERRVEAGDAEVDVLGGRRSGRPSRNVFGGAVASATPCRALRGDEERRREAARPGRDEVPILRTKRSPEPSGRTSSTAQSRPTPSTRATHRVPLLQLAQPLAQVRAEHGCAIRDPLFDQPLDVRRDRRADDRVPGERADRLPPVAVHELRDLAAHDDPARGQRRRDHALARRPSGRASPRRVLIREVPSSRPKPVMTSSSIQRIPCVRVSSRS